MVFLLLAAFLVRGCLADRAEDRLRDYESDVSELVAESDRLVGRPLFERLRRAGSPVDLESDLNQLAVTAANQVERAEQLDVPDGLRPAHRNLLLALELRQTGLRKIAEKVGPAFARAGDDDDAVAAVRGIAADMQTFLTSDVLYDLRVVPFLRERLADEEIEGEPPYPGQFLPSVAWLSPEQVGQELGREAVAGGAAARGGPPAPGRHGHALNSVSVGDTTLQPGETINRIPAGARTTFVVAFANQGDNEEVDVPVSVRIGGSGTRTITASRRVERTEAGEETEASIPLTEAPPIGQPVEVEVEVAKVPGEELVENNSQTYTVIFER